MRTHLFRPLGHLDPALLDRYDRPLCLPFELGDYRFGGGGATRERIPPVAVVRLPLAAGLPA
jgi:hypothetical protein